MAGSMAAAWQSAIGNVVAGSTFATLQSMGATGTFVAVQTAGFGTVAAGAAGALASQLVGDTKQTTEAITKSKKKELEPGKQPSKPKKGKEVKGDKTGDKAKKKKK